jgi:hypothetical protein
MQINLEISEALELDRSASDDVLTASLIYTINPSAHAAGITDDMQMIVQHGVYFRDLHKSLAVSQY